MAEQGWTVRVSGLPTDIEEDRLTDKLCIHFLRTSNGGGEIASVTIVKGTPVSALVTFEDSGVAQRVIQHGQHILKVDGKQHELTLTEHRQSLEPDKVILSMSVTVDYSQLPLGRTAVTALNKRHPEIQINYNTPEKLCKLMGPYSQVQAALAQLLGFPGSPGSAEHVDTGRPSSSGSGAAHTKQRPHTHEAGNQSRRPKERREHTEQVHIGRPEDRSSGPRGDLTPGSHSWEDTGQTEGGAVALQLAGDPTTAEEDFSLNMDADMFQYLKKRCGEEYKEILSQYGVEVVDVTNQGVTTIFLQRATWMEGVGCDQECLKLASGELSRLYQENEGKIRRAQLSKSILTPRGGLQRAMENLGVRLPKLLLSEDEQNIFIIGSSSDVSEAKQFLLLDNGEAKDKGEDVTSLLRSPSFDVGSSKPTDEERFTLSSILGSPDGRAEKMLRLDEDERRTEGARRYKLAARFKDSGLGGLGTRPGDFSLPGTSSPSRRTGLGPILGHDVLSEAAGFAGGGLSRATAQNTGGDILFKSVDTLFPSTSMQNKASTSVNSQHTFTSAPLNTTQTSLPGSTPLPPTGSNLKRASSFSGTSRPKAQVMNEEDQEDPGTSTTRVRARSSSFSNRAGRDKREVYSAELTVNRVIWLYIKEVYGTRLEDLTSDLQVKEKDSESSRDLTVVLRGVDSSSVSSCQLSLQKLLATVNTDFCVQLLRLSELGVSNPEDETLEVCCDEVRSRFKKVVIQISKESLFLRGPKQLCSQVGAALREVFSGTSVQIPEQQDFSSPFTSILNQPTPAQVNEDQNTNLHISNNPQQKLDNQRSRDDATGSGQERKSIQREDSSKRQRGSDTDLTNGSVSQPLVRKDPVVKEKVGRAGAMPADGQKTDAFIGHSTKRNDTSVRRVNGIGPTAVHIDQDVTQKDKRPEMQDKPEASRSSQGGICVCGESGASVQRTDCGVTLCSKCLILVHVHCRVCPKTEPVPLGIQGNMSYSELPISLLGHSKDCTVKITYCIPDGIQGEGDPSPGFPFQGGVFEAFLPLCDRTRKLLPRLERAFRLGLTFTVTDREAGARVTWDGIPHKTSLQGGKSGNGYPDSSYLTRLSEVLTSHGIEETAAKSED